MLQSTKQAIHKVGKSIGLTDEDIDFLLQVDNEHIFDIALKNGRTYTAYRMQHKNIHGPYKGGIRFHPEVDADEVRALSILMSLKTAAVGLPLGGGKGGVAVDPRQLTDEELEELSRAYVKYLHPHIGPEKDVPAPDVNTDSRIIDWMVEEYEFLTSDTSRASFTGKSVGSGGSEGREEATGRGGVLALREVLFAHGKSGQPLTVAIQGFGNVGLHFCLQLEGLLPNLTVVAATDSRGGVQSENGLNLKRMAEHKNNGGTLAAYEESGVTLLSPDSIISVEADVLVLAALGGVITTDNVNDVKATYILELANGPVEASAEHMLEHQNIRVIPDILANAGGVIVSYLEWLQNRSGEHWSGQQVNEKLEDILVPAVASVLTDMKNMPLTMREAALARAMKSLLQARS